MAWRRGAGVGGHDVRHGRRRKRRPLHSSQGWTFGSGNNAIATTSIYCRQRHCHWLLTLPRTRIGWRGGGLVATLFIHCHRVRRRRLLRLRSQDDGAEEDDRGNRQDRHAHNITRGAGMSPPARALHDADAASHGAIAAVSLHVLHVVLNLIVACSSISPRPPRCPKFDCCVRFEPSGPGHVAHTRRASSPCAASGSRWRSS